MNKFILFCLIGLGFSSAGPAMAASADDNAPVVLASVHPLGLVAASVVPANHLKVLVPAGMTPHDFALRPSDIDVIQNADIILWSGPDSEPYLKGFAQRWPDKVWIDASSIGKTLYQQDPQLIGAEAINDPHWWFSAEVAGQLQNRLADEMGVSHQDFDQQLQAALEYSHDLLADVKERGFFVFHRAYDHWVHTMGLNMKGAFTLSPEQKPGIRTLQEMRLQLQRGDVVCVFSEPMFSPAMIDRIVEGVEVGRAELDPMAMQIPLQADGYPQLIRDMAERAHDCLAAVESKPATELDNTVYANGDDGHHHHHDHGAHDEHASDEHHEDHDGHDHDEHADHDDHDEEHSDEEKEGFFSRLLK